MRKTVLIVIVVLFYLFSCNNSSSYKPEGLRKLSDAERINRARTKRFISENVVFKDSLGNSISRNKLHEIDQEKYWGDHYVNSANEVVEIVIRKATSQDKTLIKKIEEAFAEVEPVTTIDIDCSKTTELLETVYENDQGNRNGGSAGNPEVDKKNLQVVVSIVEKCGFPTVEKQGFKSVEAVFLVIQHAGKRLREKYFPQIKKSAERGDLQWSTVALMEDRMLMDKGEKQKYGSQVKKDNDSENWTLYPIQDPENVNKRRAEIGLGPLEEYLKHFGIEYTPGK